MNSENILTLQNISKTYACPHGEVRALKHINLTVNRGESVAIMGPSGSGKSTLLHLLGCLDPPTSGTYFLQQQNPFLLSDKELSRLRGSHIGFVFQAYNLIPQLTVYENIEIPFRYQEKRLSDEIIHDKIIKGLQAVKLEHRLKHKPSQLSGGEMQRAAIARAMAMQPRLLLADEPTGNLDRETGQAILALLHEARTTLILVTHDPQVGDTCKKMIHMRDGCICE